MSDLATEIKQRLQDLAPLHLELVDESHLHAGHAGSRGGAHFQLLIVSNVFAHQSRVARQRMVQECLRDLFAGRIHALGIKALSADEFFG